jgi:hypothetical protein
MNLHALVYRALADLKRQHEFRISLNADEHPSIADVVIVLVAEHAPGLLFPSVRPNFITLHVRDRHVLYFRREQRLARSPALTRSFIIVSANSLMCLEISLALASHECYLTSKLLNYLGEKIDRV